MSAPPDTRHADPADVRRTALATAVYDALAGFGPDTYPAALAAAAGWSAHDFAAAVARVASAEQQVDEHQTRLDAAVAHTDDATRARWTSYMMAAGDDPRVRQVRARVRAGEVEGPFADLVRRQLEMLDALDRWAEAHAWAGLALEEVRAQRNNEGADR